jgi:hypothetical protein
MFKPLRRKLREVGEWLYPVRPTRLTEDLRRSTYEHLLEDRSSRYISADNVVATFILRQIKDEVEIKTSGLRNIEQKAGTQIALAGTLIAIFSLLDHHMDQRWLLIPLGFLILSIVFSIWTLWSRSDTLRSPGAYNFAETVAMDNKARIAMQLSEAWIGYSLDLQLKAGQARKIAMGAWISILLGVVGLLYVTAYHNGSQMGSVHCIMSFEDEAHDAGRKNAKTGHEREAERHSDTRTKARQTGRGLQTTRSIGQIRCSVPD